MEISLKNRLMENVEDGCIDSLSHQGEKNKEIEEMLKRVQMEK